MAVPTSSRGRRPARVLGLLLPGAVLALAGCSGEEAAEGIRSYDVRVQVAADGSLAVEETIDYDFAGEERHGIVRLLPDRAPFAQNRDRVYPVTDLAVESPTGAPVDTEVTDEGGALSIRVGDEDTEVTGRHTYVLAYRVAAVADRGADGDRVAWNAVGTGWEVPIDDVEVVLSGPVEPVTASCAVGGEGERTRCAAEVGPGGELRATASGLDAGEGVTVAATFPVGTLPGAAPRYEDTFSPAQAFRATPATVGVGLAALLAVVLPVLARARRGRPARDPGPAAPQLTPPRDARPGQLGTVLDGHAQRHEVTATLLDLAVRGHLRIEEVDDADAGRETGDPPADWRLVRTPGDARGLRGYERELLEGLFADGEETALSDLQPRFGALETRVRAALYRDVVELGWFVADPAAVRRRWYALGAAALVAGVVATVVLALTSTWALAGTGLVLAGLVVLGTAGRMPQRTAAGEELRRAAAAFRDHLATAGPREPAESVRVPDLAGAARTDVAVRHLPYAVALGVADEWSRRLTAAGLDATPDWYTPSARYGGVPVWPALVAFSSPSNPVLTPPATGGSGGGVSVGGGAGGGGGGSW
ncbi:DUF2207 domain-containing protein [Geodermatophilus sabuli]|uniref:Predicted membrane protein n=1 Tax=Geodermatophilus sabuli TaxID=1564158 RepID=A0A285EKF8_9ACTN|nr:DUF2207 domain-containing protein [Geodermatophilus sabuli]MBB3083895.1 hypothetical protein [Geodermatophilus sabuli]SNX98546.1 Predicted membrane protein [Geodermatophilus sabuli]